MNDQKRLPLLVGPAPGAVTVLAFDNVFQCIVELSIGFRNTEMSHGIERLEKRDFRTPVAVYGLLRGKP